VPGNWRISRVTRNSPATILTEFVPATLATNGRTVTFLTINSGEYVLTGFTSRFTDVDEDEWYAANVVLAGSKNLVNGKTATTYVPEADVTRAEFVTMMVRALRLSAAPSTTAAYDDMDEHWAEDYVMRARAAGLLSGIAITNFKPDEAITREEMAHILSRAAAFCKLTTDKTVTLADRVDDAGEISEAFRASVASAVALNLLEGMSASTFEPQGVLTRAQAATVLVRFCRAMEWID
jgi:hypothetical protein